MSDLGAQYLPQICPDMISDPPKVFQDDTQIWGLVCSRMLDVRQNLIAILDFGRSQ